MRGISSTNLVNKAAPNDYKAFSAIRSFFGAIVLYYYLFERMQLNHVLMLSVKRSPANDWKKASLVVSTKFFSRPQLFTFSKRTFFNAFSLHEGFNAKKTVLHPAAKKIICVLNFEKEILHVNVNQKRTANALAWASSSKRIFSTFSLK